MQIWSGLSAGQYGLKHVAIALAVTAILALELVIRAERRRRARAKRPPPDRPIEEYFSASGRFKAIVLANDANLLRIEVFERVESGSTDADAWRRVSGPSFVDQEGIPAAVQEALRAAERPS